MIIVLFTVPIANIFIVEDQLLIAEDTAQRVRNLGYNVSGIATNATEALEGIGKTFPDIILMDIDLEGDVDGIELAAKIDQLMPTPIIYLTDLGDQRTIERAGNVHQAIFMNKPFNDHILASHIELALQQKKKTAENSPAAHAESKVVFLKKGKQRYRVNTENICFIKAARAYCEVYLKSPHDKVPHKAFEPAVSLAEALHQLSTPPFLQVHRSYVVNINHIEALEENNINIGQEVIPIGPSYKRSLKEVIKTI